MSFDGDENYEFKDTEKLCGRLVQVAKMSLQHFRVVLLEDLHQVLDQGIAGLLDSLRCNLATLDGPKHNVTQVFN